MRASDGVAPGDGARRAAVHVNLHSKCVGRQRDGFAMPRPAMRRQRHRHVAVIDGTLGFEIARRAQRLDATFKTVTTKGTAAGKRKAQQVWIRGAARQSLWLQNRILLRSKGI